MLSLISAELKMDVLRERECKDSLERQLTEEQKLRGETRVQYSNLCFNMKKSIIIDVDRRHIYFSFSHSRQRRQFAVKH